MKCVNIDWLSVFGGCDYTLLGAGDWENGWSCVSNERGTRMFKKWVTIYSNKSKVAEICYDPYSLKKEGGIYAENACTLQICNRYCYDNRLFNILACIAARIRFKMRCVSRVDICIDFIKFDNGMTPKNLILGYYSSKYLKTGYSKALGVGIQYSDYNPQTLSFKGKNSAISFKLYNKSQEMKDKKEKRYIQDAWHLCGLKESDVWRLECSIKSDGRDIVNKETGEFIKIDIAHLSVKEMLYKILVSMTNSRFKWLVNEPGKKRSEMRVLELFKDKGAIYSPIKVTAAKDFNKRSKTVKNAILEALDDCNMNVYERGVIRESAIILSQYYRWSIEDRVEYMLKKKASYTNK